MDPELALGQPKRRTKFLDLEVVRSCSRHLAERIAYANILPTAMPPDTMVVRFTAKAPMRWRNGVR